AHGGAGDYAKAAPEVVEARKVALAAALRKGGAILEGGGRSLDAVVAAIRMLEDSGAFDAGKGSYYSEDGVPELDASLMDGSTLAAGAVASVRRVANPIELARLVMQRTRHVLLVGSGAEEFARSQGMELVSPYYFFNEREWARWRKAREAARGGTREADPARERGTVGVVALDRAGHLAAGTSTGGTVMKMPGRVGDSPIIGAGTYANDASCAVSATGTGEYFIRNVVAADVCHRVRYLRLPLAEAADQVVMRELVAQGGDGGVIALDAKGNVATPFNTQGMLTGVLRQGGAIRLQGLSRGAPPVEIPVAP
ncbi:MAG TPA: isoaspartyl peptidase/L-asparaginase, partial [Anaeromyxobacteraceae bacterium]|nr:isoaspartyl peptidase/L-asparaginase [Anaeromyxobacteraceae bacterium]